MIQEIEYLGGQIVTRSGQPWLYLIIDTDYMAKVALIEKMSYEAREGISEPYQEWVKLRDILPFWLQEGEPLLVTEGSTNNSYTVWQVYGDRDKASGKHIYVCDLRDSVTEKQIYHVPINGMTKCKLWDE